MILKEMVLLCAPSSRTFAYVQALADVGALPQMCYILAEPNEECRVHKKHNDEENKYFRVNLTLTELLEEFGLPYQVLGVRDANSDTVFEALKKAACRYIIYSGYGGCILQARLFNIGKQFIHIHAGLLPAFRGSTTAYYSILKERSLGATGIFMNDKIDEGQIIMEKSFPLPQGDVNIDYVYEPWIRAQVLAAIAEEYIQKGEIQGRDQEDEGDTYFIIHPVLKHMALLMLEKDV